MRVEKPWEFCEVLKEPSEHKVKPSKSQKKRVILICDKKTKVELGEKIFLNPAVKIANHCRFRKEKINNCLEEIRNKTCFIPF